MAALSCSLLNILLHLLLSSSLLFILSNALHNDVPEGYVVYMGSSAGSNADAQALEAEHLELLSYVLPSEEKQSRWRLIHSYSHAFRGFSAMLTDKEASELSERSGVVSVFRDRVLPLHTTRSWDFLDSESGVFWRRSRLPASSDIIIGIIDTGVWPESPSFNDAGMGKIPAKWKGVCMEGPDFKKSHCNRKLIGARYYDSHIDPIHPDHHNHTARDRTSATGGSPRDGVGHGTHTASTAAGAAVQGASYYGLGKGTARGASSSRLAVYKACAMGGCAGSSILKALDDAVADGVDVVSVSIGIGSAFQADFLSDPIAIGALHAHEHGVVVVCSGGNDGPDPGTVVNAAPWIVTAAASSIDRGFEADVVLGDGSVIKGSAITFSNLTRWTPTPLVFGGDIAGDFTPSFEASNCYPGSLDPTKAAGKIVVCVDTDISVSRRVKKLVAQGVGARGLIVVDDIDKGASFDAGTFPFSELSKQDGARVLHYINSTKNPTATVLPSVDVTQLKPAPVVAFFSSRGPGGLTQSVLKPDLMAPGVGILAAWIPPTDATDVPRGQRASGFAIKSGTSMSSPHVAGAAAIVKSVHPNWTPSMIRSALMTTATTWNNLGKQLTTTTGSGANYHDTGAGEISPLRALEPGLVFETTTSDYLLFLCHYGYKSRLIASVAGVANFTCPAVVADDLISAINYPSISVSRLDGTVTVRRTVTNVGPANSTYVATVQAPKGLAVAVRPDKLVFSPHSWKASFDVSFRAAKGAAKGYRYGSITWWDGTHWVRSVFAVNVV